MNVHNSFIYNCKELETIQMSISKWIDKLWYIQWNATHQWEKSIDAELQS